MIFLVTFLPVYEPQSAQGRQNKRHDTGDRVDGAAATSQIGCLELKGRLLLVNPVVFNRLLRSLGASLLLPGDAGLIVSFDAPIGKGRVAENRVLPVSLSSLKFFSGDRNYSICSMAD